MNNAQRRRWKVKDTVFAEWRELASELIAPEIWEMRVTGKIWIAIPIREGGEDSKPGASKLKGR